MRRVDGVLGVGSLSSDRWCLLADLQRAERRPSLATSDFGLGRGNTIPRLEAREVVRVRLKAVVSGVEDRHPPREARATATTTTATTTSALRRVVVGFAMSGACMFG